jgi:hypothetical protein
MAATDKLDLYKFHKDQYAAPKSPALVTISEAAYLTVDGRGAPGGAEFESKIGALYGAAYTIKMTRKATAPQDYVICKLETVWSFDDPTQNFDTVPPEQWQWKMMIRTPDFVEPSELERAAAVLIEKGKAPQADQVKLERLGEGLCVQMLHVGPYEEEPRTFEQMAGFAGEQGLVFHGHHHEIYLSDPRRVPPERLKTILRHPVRRSE